MGVTMGAKLQAITPKGTLVNVRAVRQAFVGVLTDVGRETADDYRKTTKTWKRKPRFTVSKPTSAAGVISIVVGTDNEIFRFIDEGTRPHLIVPRNAKVLAFPSGFRAKTSPGVIGSSAGGSFGNTRYARAVYHPGTRARLFTKIIQARNQQKIAPRFQKELARVLK